MTYTKPELVALTPAVEAIQGVGKPHILMVDWNQGSLFASIGSYEADE